MVRSFVPGAVVEMAWADFFETRTAHGPEDVLAEDVLGSQEVLAAR